MTFTGWCSIQVWICLLKKKRIPQSLSLSESSSTPQNAKVTPHSLFCADSSYQGSHMPHVQPARNASAAKIACDGGLNGLIHQLATPESSSGRLFLEERGMQEW